MQIGDLQFFKKKERQKIHILVPPATTLNIPDMLGNVSCLDEPIIHMAGIFAIVRLDKGDVLYNNYGEKNLDSNK